MLKRDISRRGYVPFYEHAKIIAIVDKDGEVLGYDFTVTEKACDFFADPDDRERFTAITVQPVPSDSRDEIKGKLNVAEKYLRIGQYLAREKGLLKRSASDESYDKSWEHDCGLQLLVPGFPLISPWTVSPLARAQFVSWPNFLQANDQMTADYKLGDIVRLRVGNLKMKVTILARHDDGAEQYFIGSRNNAELVGFQPKHVIHHTKRSRKWKIKLEQQSDASPPESVPKLEQSGEVDPAPEAPEQAEQIVPPPALTLRRRCDRPGRKHQ